MLNINFCGLKENIYEGKTAIKAVKEKFPEGFHSDTYYRMFESIPQ